MDEKTLSQDESARVGASLILALIDSATEIVKAEMTYPKVHADCPTGDLVVKAREFLGRLFGDAILGLRVGERDRLHSSGDPSSSGPVGVGKGVPEDEGKTETKKVSGSRNWSERSLCTGCRRTIYSNRYWSTDDTERKNPYHPNCLPLSILSVTEGDETETRGVENANYYVESHMSPPGPLPTITQLKKVEATTTGAASSEKDLGEKSQGAKDPLTSPPKSGGGVGETKEPRRRTKPSYGVKSFPIDTGELRREEGQGREGGES